MNSSSRGARWRALIGVALAAAIVMIVPGSALGAGSSAPKAYIVQLEAPPLAAYGGGTDGLSATSPEATGERKLAARSSAARQYRSFLTDRRRATLESLPGATPTPFYTYSDAFAGYAARLTPDQVGALREDPRVAHVWPNTKRHIDPFDPGDPAQVNAALGGATGESPSYLGLPLGLWDTFGGPDQAGSGVIIADIDTGITPEHPSFSDDPSGGDYIGSPYGPPPAKWQGICQTGQAWTAADCNNKLIGDRWYVAGFGQSNIAPDEFLSARDADGHGSHTSATAAGNFGVQPQILGNNLGVDLISGIAPRARVAEYKVCWEGKTGSADGCTNADIIKAIDAAVGDGADVITFSIGSASSEVIGPDSYAFLGAFEAGVFVSTAAGNDGPDPGTVGAPSTVPWVTSVAADSTSSTFQASATVTPSSGPPFDLDGASVTGALADTPVVDAAASGLTGVSAAKAQLCGKDTLDPAKVTGKVVLCLRGVNARIDKSKQVQAAGGVGMILYNESVNEETVTDTHWVPTVHVSHADGLLLKNAIAAGPTSVAISAGTRTALPRGGILAAFSSRGPQTAVPDILKPDLAAPGVNILAAASPTPAASLSEPAGELFQSISGTSMATPHVAGAAALLKQANPDWGPEAIKSALMTTADTDVLQEDGTTPANPFQTGSGEIDPTAAADPGLVFDLTTDDFVRYLGSQDPTILAAGQQSIRPHNLNLPSVAEAVVPGLFNTVRTVTSTDDSTRQWNAEISVPGFDTEVTTGAGFSIFSLAPGASKSLFISARRTGAPLGKYAYGAMTLTSGSTVLHVPVALRPVGLIAPGQVSVTSRRPKGSARFGVKTGYSGPLNLLGFGLAAPHIRSGQSVSTSATGLPNPGGGGGQRTYDFRVRRHTQLFSAGLTRIGGGRRTDLDLYLYRDANHNHLFTPSELVGSSATETSLEQVNEVLPDPGLYRLVVVGYSTRSPSSYALRTWSVRDGTPNRSSGGPSIRVTGNPQKAGTGVVIRPRLRFNGVRRKGVYLGVLTYHTSGPATLGNAAAATVVELHKTVTTR